ncbi:MAG: InlB B-repeat-containing protein, partial [Clostridia bacterium]|nr:InlB B-repeat-containing protein [Clostridia bacterium]
GTSANNYPDSDGPTTLYAKWTGNTYYIKYNANGGSGTMENSTHIYGTTSSLSLNTFTREGYDFAGWAVSATGTKAYSDGGKVTRATSTNGGIYNLYALWTVASYDIILATNNAEYGNVSAGGTFVYNTEQTFFACPSSGCSFKYWLDENGNIYTENPLTLIITTDLTLTAIFINGILDGLAVVAEAGGEARINGFNDSDTTVHFSAVAYAGYQFDGWYIYGETTPLSTARSADLEKSIINNQLIVAKFSEIQTNVNTETNNTGNLA